MELTKASTAELTDAVEQLHGLECAARRELLRALAELDAREAWRDDGATSLADWIAFRLGMTFRSARVIAETAVALEGLPAIARLFESGELSWGSLVSLCRLATSETDAELADEVRSMTPAQIEVVARRVTKQRRLQSERADDRRFLHMTTERDTGVLRLAGRLRADQGAVVKKAIERLADRAPKDPDGQFVAYEIRAADALTEIASANIAEDGDADRATIVVHADLSALSGGDGIIETEDGVGLHPETARRIACDARIQWVAHAKDGRPLGVGRASRTPPPWLARLIKQRDRGCRWPGCGRARRVNIHHIEHWIPHGNTDLDNLVALCSYHHHLVHEGGWDLRGDPGGKLEVVRPDGSPLEIGPKPLRQSVRARLLPGPGVAPTGPPSRSPQPGTNPRMPRASKLLTRPLI